MSVSVEKSETIVVTCDKCKRNAVCRRDEIERVLFGWLRVVAYALPDAVFFHDLDDGGQLVGAAKDVCPLCAL